MRRDKDGNPELPFHDRKRIFREKLDKLYKNGWNCIQTKPSFNAAILYRIVYHKHPKTGENHPTYVDIKRIGINVFGGMYADNIQLRKKQSIRLLRDELDHILDHLDEEKRDFMDDYKEDYTGSNPF